MKRIKPVPVVVVPGRSAQALEALEKKHACFDEKFLQDLLAEHTELLPVRNLRSDVGSLLCVGREIPAGEAGNIDNLYLSTSGYPVLVETKLWRNSQARREVLAQAIDYLKEIVRKDFNWFSDQWEIYQKKCGKPRRDLIAALGELVGDGIDESDFIDRVNTNLRQGDIIALIVGDGIETRLQELVDYLCQDSAQWRYTLSLVELGFYRLSQVDPDALVIVPQIIQQVEPIQRAYVRIEVAKELAGTINVTSVTEPQTRTRRRQSLSESDFLQAIEKSCGLSAREQIREFYTELAEACGLEIEVLPTSLFLKLPHPTGEHSPANLLGVDTEGRVYNPKTLRFLLNGWGLDPETVEEIVTSYWKDLHRIDPRFGLDGLKTASSKRFPPFQELKPKLREIREQVGNVVSRINKKFDQEA